jgi:hypothetical protein
MRSKNQVNSVTSMVTTQAIAIFAFVFMPGLITYVVPRTTIQLRRVNDHASAVITKHILLVVPIQTTTIESLMGVESRVTAEKTRRRLTREDRQRGRSLGTTFADGSVLLWGNGHKVQIQSNPDDAPVQAQRIQGFIDDPAAEPMMILATAPWTLTYLLGGILTGFTVLYVVGSFLAITRFLLQRIWGGDPKAK